VPTRPERYALVIYTPDVQLIHHVSSSRGTLDPLEDRNRFIRRWDIFGTFKDPFFPEACCYSSRDDVLPAALRSPVVNHRLL